MNPGSAIRGNALLWRVLFSAAALAAAVACNFFLMHAMPGDYISHLLDSAPGGFTLKAPAGMLQRQFDSDTPLPLRFFIYVSDILTGEWGRSFAYAKPVSRLVGQRLLWSLALLLPAKLVSLGLGVVLGAFSGWHSERKRDFFLLSGMLFVNAVPSYIWSLAAIFLFAYHLNLFPLCGFVGPEALGNGMQWGSVVHHGMLPFLVLTICGIPGVYYLVRNTMSMVARQDYIVNARAAGVGEATLLFRHALPNAMLPLATLIPLQVAHLMMGSVFIEAVFSWPGVGLLVFEAISARDLPVLQGVLLVFTGLLIAGNLLSDFSYGAIDPRVRAGV